MAWWDNNGVQQWDGGWQTAPVSSWGTPGVSGTPITAERFGQFDAGGDFDTDGVPGMSYRDYLNFLGTYMGGDASNFGQPGYEQGTQFLQAPRVTPQQTSSPYQLVTLADGRRYYGNQQQAQTQAFRQNNPVTAGQNRRPAATAPATTPYGQGGVGIGTPPPPPAPMAPTKPTTPTATGGMPQQPRPKKLYGLGGY